MAASTSVGERGRQITHEATHPQPLPFAVLVLVFVSTAAQLGLIVCAYMAFREL